MSGVIVGIAPLVAFLAVVWVALLVSGPMLPAAPAGILYAFGSRICHQIAERSFHLGAAQLPVCARCLGIYAGFALGLVVAVAHSATARWGARDLPPQRAQNARWGPPGLTIRFGREAGESNALSEPRAWRRASRRAKRPPSWQAPGALVAVAAFPTAITLLLEWAGLWPTSNLTRAVAGVPLGVGVALVVISGLTESPLIRVTTRRPHRRL